MNRVCSVCKTSRKDAILYRFPQSEKRLLKWLECLKRDDLRKLTPKKLLSRYVCQKHFEKKFFTPKLHLLGTAYPSLFTEDEISSGIPSSQEFEDTENKHRLEHCYSRKRHLDHTYSKTGPLKECNSSALNGSQNLPGLSRKSTTQQSDTLVLRSHQTMHLFPNPTKDRDRFNQWVLSIGGDIIGLENDDIYKHRSVCHAHFEEKFCCRFNRICNIAVPTLNLPESSSLPKFTFEERRPMRQIQNELPKQTSALSTSLSESVIPSNDADMQENIDGIGTEALQTKSVDWKATGSSVAETTQSPDASIEISFLTDDSEVLEHVVNVKKVRIRICKVCLRTDKVVKTIDHRLSMLYSNLCGSEDNNRFQYCNECEYLLRKFFNFTMKCQRSDTLLKKWMEAESHEKVSLQNLYKVLPPSPLAYWNSENSKIFTFTYGGIAPTGLTKEIDTDDMCNISFEFIDSKLPDPKLVEQMINESIFELENETNGKRKSNTCEDSEMESEIDTKSQSGKESDFEKKSDSDCDSDPEYIPRKRLQRSESDSVTEYESDAETLQTHKKKKKCGSVTCSDFEKSKFIKEKTEKIKNDLIPQDDGIEVVEYLEDLTDLEYDALANNTKPFSVDLCTEKQVPNKKTLLQMSNVYLNENDFDTNIDKSTNETDNDTKSQNNQQQNSKYNNNTPSETVFNEQIKQIDNNSYLVLDKSINVPMKNRIKYQYSNNKQCVIHMKYYPNSPRILNSVPNQTEKNTSIVNSAGTKLTYGPTKGKTFKVIKKIKSQTPYAHIAKILTHCLSTLEDKSKSTNQADKSTSESDNNTIQIDVRSTTKTDKSASESDNNTVQIDARNTTKTDKSVSESDNNTIQIDVRSTTKTDKSTGQADKSISGQPFKNIRQSTNLNKNGSLLKKLFDKKSVLIKNTIQKRGRKKIQKPEMPTDKEGFLKGFKEKFENMDDIKTKDGALIDKNFILKCLETKLSESMLKQLWKTLCNGRSKISAAAMKRIRLIKRKYKNDHLYESVFNIEYLTNEAEMQEEFQNRKNYDCYVNAETKCDICYQVFKFPKMLDYHRIKQHGVQTDLSCRICGKNVTAKEARSEDQLCACHDAVYKCKLCPLVTNYRMTMINHYHQHNGVMYKCEPCGLIYRHNSTYIGHLSRHHGARLICDLCGRSFYSAMGLKAHAAQMHKNQTPNIGVVRCVECHLQFPSLTTYKRHLKSQHNNPAEALKLLRGKSTKKEDEQEEDKRVYPSQMRKDEGPIPCEQCGVQLEDSRAYHGHFRRMHPDKNRTKYPSMKSPCMCELCGRIFQSYASLKDHTWVHTNERPFSCSECGKSFHMRQRLVAHRRVHAPQRPLHDCRVCGKTFANQSNRQRHMVIHTGLKPFKCEFCGKAFRQTSEKRSHVAYVHMKKPWPKRARGKRNQNPPPESNQNEMEMQPVWPTTEP